MNNITILGRITHDIEIRQTPNGTHVTTFNVAVDRYVKDGEKATDFIPVVCWRNTADFVGKYFVKGQAIAIVGSLQTRQYTDKNDKKCTAFEVVANNVYFAGSKSNGTAPATTPTLSDFDEVASDDGDLPF